MALKVFNGLTSSWFTPSSQEGEDKPAQFLIEPPTQLEFLNLMASGENYEHEDGSIFFRTDEHGRALALKQIKNWKNIDDGETGDALAFSQALLKKLIPAEILGELVSQVIASATLTGQDEKN